MGMDIDMEWNGIRQILFLAELTTQSLDFFRIRVDTMIDLKLPKSCS